MGRGGFRPGSGPKKGTKYKPRVNKAVKPGGKEKFDKKESPIFLSKAAEFAKFYKGLLDRAATGKKPTASEKEQMSLLAAELTKAHETGGENETKPVEISTADAKVFLEELLINILVDQKTKIQIANILLPYQHPRKGEGVGKKEEKNDRAKSAGAGKFSTGRAPLAVVK